jgi:hypothetical protein
MHAARLDTDADRGAEPFPLAVDGARSQWSSRAAESDSDSASSHSRRCLGCNELHVDRTNRRRAMTESRPQTSLTRAISKPFVCEPVLVRPLYRANALLNQPVHSTRGRLGHALSFVVLFFEIGQLVMEFEPSQAVTARLRASRPAERFRTNLLPPVPSSHRRHPLHPTHRHRSPP